MTAADGSPGGGAPPAPSAPAAGNPPAAAPTVPLATGGAPAIDRATEEALVKRGRDAAFAELRRSGALKKSFLQNADGGDGGDGGRPATPATPQIDTAQARRLDRALTRSGHAARLSDAAYGRIERNFAIEAPDDVDGWVQEYFGGLGVANQAAGSPAAAAPNPPITPNGPPVTDRGAPGPSKLPLEQMDILKMSDADRRALVAAKGLKFFTERLHAQLKGVRIEVRRS